MSFLHRFADARLLSELNAQKAANKHLHKRLRFEQNRANALAVNRKTTKKQVSALRKQLSKAENA